MGKNDWKRAAIYGGALLALTAGAFWTRSITPMVVPPSTPPAPQHPLAVAAAPRDQLQASARPQSAAPAMTHDRATSELVLSKDELEGERRIRERRKKEEGLIQTVASESLEESIHMLFEERMLDSFVSPVFGNGSPLEIVETQTRYLHDPRVVKILLAARDGSDEVRQQILETALVELEAFLADPEAGNLRNGMAIPIILAEVDSTGVSLPSLLRLFGQFDALAVPSDEAMGRFDALRESQSGIPVNEVMPLTAAAAWRILRRITPEENWGQELRTSRSTVVIPRFEPDPMPDRPGSELAGYSLLPELSFDEWFAVMDRVRSQIESQE